MTTTDQLRTVLRDLEAKARQMELDKKLAAFADQADHFLRVAATRAGDYAAENRDRVETTLDKAGAKVDEKTDGKYHSYVGKVRAGVLVGVDWVAEQRATGAAPAAGTTASGTTASGDMASGATSAPTTSSTAPDAGSAPATSAPEEAPDLTPPGSADSDDWVEVTDSPEPTDSPAPTDGTQSSDAADAEGSHDPRTEGPTQPQ